MSELSSRNKLKKMVRPEEPEAEPEFQIAPMVDILLVLLVFFMSISTTEVLQSRADIDLPIAADAAEAKQNPGQVIVNILFNPINNATAIEVNEQIINIPDLVPMLQRHVSRNPMVRVLIRADRQVRYDFLRQVLESVGAAGVGNVTFAVVDREM